MGDIERVTTDPAAGTESVPDAETIEQRVKQLEIRLRWSAETGDWWGHGYDPEKCETIPGYGSGKTPEAAAAETYRVLTLHLSV